MISHSKKFIFVHIPKTAGTSIMSVFGRHAITLQGHRNFDSLYFQHAYARDIARWMGDEFQRYFRFVRDPWDWVASNYAFNRGLHRPYTRGTEYDISPSVPEWAAEWSFDTWLPWWLSTFQPSQRALLLDEQGQSLVQTIIRFEDLGKEFPSLCRCCGLWPRRLPRVNRTANRQKKAHYYSAESYQLVAEHFAEDIRLFGYTALDWKDFQQAARAAEG